MQIDINIVKKYLISDASITQDVNEGSFDLKITNISDGLVTYELTRNNITETTDKWDEW